MLSRLEQGALATVFGGSGFVGRHAVRSLARDGWRIRAAERRPDLAGHLQPMGALGQISAVQANLRYEASVRQAVEGARTIARAARETGARRLIHVSAIGADARSSSEYARTKAAGERAVLEEFPDAVIIRPSIVFGPEEDFFNRFAGLARVSPFLPLIGGGRTKFQPVYVGDLAAAIAQAASGKAKAGAVYELGGPDIFTMHYLLERTQEWSGHRRPYVRLPFAVASLLALATWPLPNRLRPITLDQVRLLRTDNVVSAAAQSEGRTLAGLGVNASQTIGAIVPGYLERFRPRGQFSHYRG